VTSFLLLPFEVFRLRNSEDYGNRPSLRLSAESGELLNELSPLGFRFAAPV